MNKAAKEGNLEELKRLVEEGHDVNICDEEEGTPLILAAANSHYDCTEYLIKVGAKLDRKGGLYGRTALHWMVLNNLRYWFDDDNLELPVPTILSLFPINCNVEDDSGDSPLNLAASATTKEGFSSAFHSLIKMGADINHKGSDGQTILHSAVQKGNKEFVEILLDNKADPNARDNYGDGTLISAVAEGHIEITKLLLLYGARVNQKGANGRIALHWATKRGNVPMIQLLLVNMADCDMTDDVGDSPYKLANKIGLQEEFKASRQIKRERYDMVSDRLYIEIF